MSVAEDPFPKLRAICAALPNVHERLSHGEPTWFINAKKSFVTYSHQHHDDRVGFWCAAPSGMQEQLVADRPLQFFRPPYVGHRGWLGVFLDVLVDWNEVEDIVEDAYRAVAPKSLLSLLSLLDTETE